MVNFLAYVASRVGPVGMLYLLKQACPAADWLHYHLAARALLGQANLAESLDPRNLYYAS